MTERDQDLASRVDGSNFQRPPGLVIRKTDIIVGSGIAMAAVIASMRLIETVESPPTNDSGVKVILVRAGLGILASLGGAGGVYLSSRLHKHRGSQTEQQAANGQQPHR